MVFVGTRPCRARPAASRASAAATASGGGRVASVLYAILMTGCHVLILPLYITYVLRWAGAGFDGGPLLCLLVALVTLGTAPLMWTRTTFMLGELRRGVASGVFVEEDSKKIR